MSRMIGKDKDDNIQDDITDNDQLDQNEDIDRNESLVNGHKEETVVNEIVFNTSASSPATDNSRQQNNLSQSLSGDRGAAATNINNNAYGGARPKIFRARIRNGESSSSSYCRSRVGSETVDIKVTQVQCDNVVVSDHQPSSLPYDDLTLPRLESRSCGHRKSVSGADLSSQVCDNDGEVGGGDTVEDDCYIYTYIGGTAYLSADLPNSFFRLDSGSDGESLPGVAGAGQSNLSTGVAALIQDQMVTSPHSHQSRSFSPDQDFIEMDFDPGSSSSDDDDNDGDSGQGQEGDNDDNNDDTDHEDHDAAAVEEAEEEIELEQSPPSVLVLEHVSEPSNNNDISKDSDCSNCAEAGAGGPSVQPPPPSSLVSPTHPASAPVLSPSDECVTPLLMPRSRSLNSSLGVNCLMVSSEPGPVPLCGSRLLQVREALLFGPEESLDPGHETSPDLSSTLEKLSLPTIPTTICQKAMIWTEKEALRKQITQTPNTSSCGAVALLNVVLALDLDVDHHLVAESVDTRLRRPDSDLPDYLLSRSLAGCTHQDLLNAASAPHLRDKLRARFFPLHNRVYQLSQLLISWISLGLVPVLTLNVQKGPVCPDGQLQDSWHHTMVWGVVGQDVYLANPLDVMSESVLLPQLNSPSTLLIRRQDIVSRFHSALDLMEINRLGSRWRSMNVLGQVVNMIREERSLMKQEAAANNTESGGESVVSLSSHVNIPASYTAGVTLFCPVTNTEGLQCLDQAPDLPLVIST